MTGTLLRFYVHENRLHRHIALYEWLLEQAKALGIHGGSAFRAIAGFGRHGILHEEHFFELAAEMTVVVEFVVSDDEADKLLRGKDLERTLREHGVRRRFKLGRHTESHAEAVHSRREDAHAASSDLDARTHEVLSRRASISWPDSISIGNQSDIQVVWG